MTRLRMLMDIYGTYGKLKYTYNKKKCRKCEYSVRWIVITGLWIVVHLSGI